MTMIRRTVLLLTMSLPAFAQTAPVIESISPDNGPSYGGTEVTIRGSEFDVEVACLLPCPVTVTLGKLTIPVERANDTTLVVVTPAHDQGAVDVTVNVPGKPPVTRVNGFTFTAGQESAYEQVLLPIHVDGIINGAFGTQWKTDLWMRNNGAEEVLLAPWPCPPGGGCGGVFPRTQKFPSERSIHNLPALNEPEDGNPSRMLWVQKPGASAVSFSLRFADVSRADLDGGVEMPVIREAELLRTPAQLFNVPIGSKYRVLLRVYDVEYSSSDFQVTIYPQSEDDEMPVHTSQVTASWRSLGPFRSKASYGQIDISSLLAGNTTLETARIEVTPRTPGSRFWTVATISNNETQAVTLVTPQ
jgi:IPT/TIG domain